MNILSFDKFKAYTVLLATGPKAMVIYYLLILNRIMKTIIVNELPIQTNIKRATKIFSRNINFPIVEYWKVFAALDWE